MIVGLDDGTCCDEEVLAQSSLDAMYAVTNRLRAERGMAPYQEGLGVRDFSVMQLRRPPQCEHP